MATTKKTRKKKVEAPEAVVSAPTEVAVEESDAKKEFRKFMESYKEQNPDKYAHKEAEFIRKLNTL